MISRDQKQHLFQQAQSQMKSCGGMIIVHYSGLDVQSLTDFRVRLREVQSDFQVVKNRVFKKALESADPQQYAPLVEFFKGPVGVVFCGEDLGAGAKVVSKFAEDHQSFQVQAGFFDQNLLSPDDLKAIADLPSMDVLRTQLLSTIIAVHRQLQGVLLAVPRDLVDVIAAIGKTKS